MLVPGFIDTHVHCLDGGQGLTSVQLRDADSPSEFIYRISEHAKRRPPSSWIREGSISFSMIVYNHGVPVTLLLRKLGS